jgi:NADP-dependent 3-hydroxy acid dehydrogenase YdfG
LTHVSRGCRRGTVQPETIARAMAFAIEQPDDVDVGDIVVRPTVQG